MIYEYAGEEPPAAPAYTKGAGGSGICGIPKCKMPYAQCKCTQAELLEAGEISEASASQTNTHNTTYCVPCKGFVITCPHQTVLNKTEGVKTTGTLTWCPMCKMSVTSCEHKEHDGDYYCVKDGCHKFVVTCQHDTSAKFAEGPVQVLAQGEPLGIICDSCDKDITFCDCDDAEVRCVDCLNTYLYCACDLAIAKDEWDEKNGFDSVEQLDVEDLGQLYAEELAVMGQHNMGTLLCPTCNLDILHCNCQKIEGEEYWWEQDCDGCGRKQYGCKCSNTDECPLCELPVEKCACKADLSEWCQYCGKFQFMCECTGRW